jgi:hypothetical protein
VGQALREGLRTRGNVVAFVAKLRAGEAAFEDEATQGRTRSLAASLNYGFEHSFNEAERKQLALLHLFHAFVQVAAMQQVAGIPPEGASRLLDRAAEVGLLKAHGGGGYSIHPALPWFFRGLFEQHSAESRERALRAYVEVIASLGDSYHNLYMGGNRTVINALRAEEPNLPHARALARQRGCWTDVMRAMQGLRPLYYYTGRTTEWARLVEEIAPEFVDLAGGPSPGQEEHWHIFSGYLVEVERVARRWDEAERLQRRIVEWNRSRVRGEDHGSIRALIASLHDLGEIQRALVRPQCAELYLECFDLALQIGDRPGAAVAALKLGHSYVSVPALRSLDEAERWYQKSLELIPDGDHLNRAASLGELGSVANQAIRAGARSKQTNTRTLAVLK